MKICRRLTEHTSEETCYSLWECHRFSFLELGPTLGRYAFSYTENVPWGQHLSRNWEKAGSLCVRLHSHLLAQRSFFNWNIFFFVWAEDIPRQNTENHSWLATATSSYANPNPPRKPAKRMQDSSQSRCSVWKRHSHLHLSILQSRKLIYSTIRVLNFYHKSDRDEDRKKYT